MPTTTVHATPTDRQVSFVTDLATQYASCHCHYDPQVVVARWLRIIRTRATTQSISRQIDRMIAARDAARRVQATATATQPGRIAFAETLPNVPAGHYAVPGTGRQPLDFYRVSRPTTGRCAGLVFVKVIVGGHPEYSVGRSQRTTVLQRILDAGIVDSARRYAQEIGRCYVCNTRLTDATSRSLGIGPDCRSARTARGQAWTNWLAGGVTTSPTYTAVTRQAVLAVRNRIAAERQAREEAQAASMTPQTCTTCGDVAVGVTESQEAICDECSIDRDLPVYLFPARIRRRLAIVA